jgi:hypothetical protein
MRASPARLIVIPLSPGSDPARRRPSASCEGRRSAAESAPFPETDGSRRPQDRAQHHCVAARKSASSDIRDFTRVLRESTYRQGARGSAGRRGAFPPGQIVTATAAGCAARGGVDSTHERVPTGGDRGARTARHRGGVPGRHLRHHLGVVAAASRRRARSAVARSTPCEPRSSSRRWDRRSEQWRDRFAAGPTAVARWARRILRLRFGGFWWFAALGMPALYYLIGFFTRRLRRPALARPGRLRHHRQAAGPCHSRWSHWSGRRRSRPR